MKLLAEIDDEKHEVEVCRDGKRHFAVVDGREYDLEISEPEPGVFLFKSNSKNNKKILEVFVSPHTRSSEPFRVQTAGNSYSIRLLDPKRLRSSGAGSDHGDGAAEIRTAMPGKVVRLLVNVGAQLNKGEGVVVVEAMKMQNELKTPKAGIVKEIKVADGTTVAAGDVLAVIE